ncbi:folate family ECF transporter S component [Periweissella fabalis]|uniref:Folate family ECF transporter S component n=1 Tax=Periweissella fabalis TaxID=1070421 RepID=A0A7X6S3H5_9LACO|nr:folate family ECF transporter S component [Periweissella fabalis]MCM0598502.1 folate family ECF transporter S component [Periweissella fabalis]NKZ24216.1 folate family ECF transporter S component [Periweissella fabalis]
MKTFTFGYPQLSAKAIALLGTLSALQLVISRFTFGTSFLKIAFTFIIITLIAKWFGPILGTMVAIINDYLGTLIQGSPFFIGFTLSAICAMLIYGIFFYQQPTVSWKRVIIANFLVLLISDTLLNTGSLIMIYHLTGNAATKLVELRSIKEIIMWFIEVPVIHFILNNQQLEKLRQRALG